MKPGAIVVSDTDARVAAVRAAYAAGYPWSGCTLDEALAIARQAAYDGYTHAVLVPHCSGIVFVVSAKAYVLLNSPAHLMSHHRRLLSAQ